MCCALRNGDSQLAIITSLAVAAEAAEQLAIMVAGRVALETTAQALLADEPAQSRDLGVGAGAALDENFQARP
jgi:ABC-type branched-subunit amino acid transport system ATPase component